MAPDESRNDIERSRAGDQAALETLLVKHMHGLEGYLRLRMGNLLRRKESCADLVQSVCREVLGELDRFDYRGEAAFKHWLYTRAQHKLLHKVRDLGAQRRDARREQPLADVDQAHVLHAYRTIATPSRALADKEAIEHVERAFDSLPEDYRDAVTMRRMMDLDYSEIAERMGRSEGAVRNLVHRGIARLTLMLDGGDDDPVN